MFRVLTLTLTLTLALTLTPNPEPKPRDGNSSSFLVCLVMVRSCVLRNFVRKILI